MKIFITLLLFFIPGYLLASDISIVELHETKSLDQLVLESENKLQNQSNEENIEVENFNDEEEDVEEDVEEKEQRNEIVEEENTLSENNEIIDILNFWETIDPSNLKIYFDNINNINSPILYNEFVKLLNEFDLDINISKNNEIFYLIVVKLVELGEIQKAYNLIKSNELINDKNLLYYQTLELNYLFSTYQLVEACELKNELNLLDLKLLDYFLEKADIFCLVMEGKIDEANLLNSILLETESKVDQYFQDLLNILFNSAKDGKETVLRMPQDYSESLIFLYSAMMRIAELPLTEKFLLIDPDNLSIPIILSNSTKLEIRIKAANKAYLGNLISIESLAALYQSVDFNSYQLNNPTKTIDEIKNNNELTMAYYFQLANIQIFPSSRLDVILDFWDLAESIGLEKISYNLTYNIISSIEPTMERAKFGTKLATAFIYNNDFEQALKWIVFSENSNTSIDELEKVKLLYDLYQSDDSQKIFNYINNNYENLNNSETTNIKEILNVTLSVFYNGNIFDSNIFFENVMDERLMPTLFLNSQIQQAIANKDESNLFFLLLLSLDGKKWSEIHPEHLKTFLEGIKNYKDANLLKNILLNIFEQNKIF